MEPIFNGHGCTVGWLREDIVYDASGQPSAFIRNGAVFSYSGGYLGRLDRGIFRDLNGHAVAFMHGASGGPMLPVPAVPPVPPVPQVPPVSPVPVIPPVPPVPSLSWSLLTWEEFLAG